MVTTPGATSSHTHTRNWMVELNVFVVYRKHELEAWKCRPCNQIGWIRVREIKINVTPFTVTGLQAHGGNRCCCRCRSQRPEKINKGQHTYGCMNHSMTEPVQFASRQIHCHIILHQLGNPISDFSQRFDRREFFLFTICLWLPSYHSAVILRRTSILCMENPYVLSGAMFDTAGDEMSLRVEMTARELTCRMWKCFSYFLIFITHEYS